MCRVVGPAMSCGARILRHFGRLRNDSSEIRQLVLRAWTDRPELLLAPLPCSPCPLGYPLPLIFESHPAAGT